MQNQGVRFWTGGYTTWLATAYGKLNRPPEGLQAVSEALAAIATTEERLSEAELYRLRGELLVGTADQHAAAEAAYQTALVVARGQAAKSWELRAATSLPLLWHGQGKRAEARELLAPVYDWFTEGFDTADLQEAKALLEELA